MAALIEFSDATMLNSSLLLSDGLTSQACCDSFSANSFNQSVIEFSDHIAFNETLFEALQPPSVNAAEELVHVVAPVEDTRESSGGDSTTYRAMQCGGKMKGMKLDAGCRVGFRMRSEVEILDDGFKWRKYGKKSVKNSPYPRNYYRCSSHGCCVKKRVERDPKDSDYVITAYEGVHNHISPGAVSYSRFQRSSCSS